ncbi:MAG: hypothetical protein PIR02_16010 [Microbacterium enclense]
MSESDEEPNAMDPISTAVGTQIAQAGGGVLARLLGPLADEWGQELLNRYRNRNVKRVVDRADEKSENGTIPLRVAAEVFDKAQWADDEFIAEYLSGVLAGARTPSGADDRGVSWTALIGRMSSDQLRLHYILCRAFRDHVLADPTVLRYGRPVEPDQVTISDHFADTLVVNMDDVKVAIAGEAAPDETVHSRVVDALYGLDAEKLVESGSLGTGQWLNSSPDNTQTYPDWNLFTVNITLRGARLAMQAAGLGDVWPIALTDDADNPLDRISITDPIPPVRTVRESSLPGVQRS